MEKKFFLFNLKDLYSSLKLDRKWSSSLSQLLYLYKHLRRSKKTFLRERYIKTNLLQRLFNWFMVVALINCMSLLFVSDMPFINICWWITYATWFITFRPGIRKTYWNAATTKIAATVRMILRARFGDKNSLRNSKNCHW